MEGHCTLTEGNERNTKKRMDAPLSFRASLAQYQELAKVLLEAFQSGDEAAAWRFKWQHTRFRGKPIAEVCAATFNEADSQLVIARENGFGSWTDVAAFTDSVRSNGAVERFESAVAAVVSGDAMALRTLLREDQELLRARSTRSHHATLPGNGSAMAGTHGGGAKARCAHQPCLLRSIRRMALA
jgi:hypothetical protein